jgi:hypothetical protein
MRKNALLVIILIVVVAAVGVLVFRPGGGAGPEIVALAQCLAEKNFVMYGARTCSWCEKEKANFGSAFDYVPYVECSAEPQTCIEAGIQGTPTWVLPDGRKLVGYQGLEKLSLESGCSLQ